MRGVERVGIRGVACGGAVYTSDSAPLPPLLPNRQ